MTTSTPEPQHSPELPTDLLLSEPDPRAKLHRRRVEFWQICWLISLSSLLISLYALFLSQRLAPVASQLDLDHAALVLANELSSLTVMQNRFGKVGLLHYRDASRVQMGLNGLQATLRLDGIVARQLGFDSMADLVTADATSAAFSSKEFAELERSLAQPNGKENLGRETFPDIVKKVLNHTGAGNRLRSLKISVGALKNSKYGSATPLPAMEKAGTAFYADGENYRTHIKVPIWNDLNYEFYELADKPSLVSPAMFTPVDKDLPASVVLIEAEFDVAERGRMGGQKKMQACAIAGGASYENPNSAFMLSFPQGYLSAISCLNDLFSPSKYAREKGDWLQAAGGDVPGQGHLTVVADDKLRREPNLAAVDLLYHYMFNVGPELNPANLKRLLNEPISTASMHADEKANAAEAINSGLFKDTGAASFALNKQSQPGAEGQKVIAHAFSGVPISQLMPSSTFPLVVDSDGTLRFAQDNGFDQEFLKEFQEALYKTNIAGIESMQVAATVVNRMQNAIEQSDKKLAQLNEEIVSAKRSLESVSAQKAGDATLKMNQLSEQIASLLVQQQREQNRKQRNLQVKQLATQVRKNGREAARSSYEIAAHMSAFAAEGVRRITAPFKGYLLSRNVAFIPHTSPVDESDLYELADADSLDGRSAKDPQAWTSNKFEVNQIPDNFIFVEGKPIMEYWQTVPVRTVNRPLFVILSSAELLKDEAPKLYLSRQTPFDNGAIGKSELFYLAPQSIESGKESRATWTVLMRDLVYSRTETSGQPLQSIRPRWCVDVGMHEESCPGLAVELQIRTPIPKLKGALSSLYLQDPDGAEQVSLFPPLPAEMI